MLVVCHDMSNKTTSTYLAEELIVGVPGQVSDVDLSTTRHVEK
jgi:hypothetical protein